VREGGYNAAILSVLKVDSKEKLGGLVRRQYLSFSLGLWRSSYFQFERVISF
jgi:hypothetical protein